VLFPGYHKISQVSIGGTASREKPKLPQENHKRPQLPHRFNDGISDQGLHPIFLSEGVGDPIEAI